MFMFCEPLTGRRQVSLCDGRTKVDWAQEVEGLLLTRCLSPQKLILICDNYETFGPNKARSLLRRLGFCHSPKHGSRSNIAETELSSVSRYCITGRRFRTVYQVRDKNIP
jgi:hypothetical protein